MGAAMVVTAPVVVVRDGTRMLRYYYVGARLPDGLPETELARLAELGLIAESGPASAVTQGPLPLTSAPVVDENGESAGAGSPDGTPGGRRAKPKA